MRSGVESDEGLVAAVRTGSLDAFAELIERHHGRMTRVAYLIVRDEALAADAVQSAWIRVWRRLSTLRRPESLRPWLFAIAANEAKQLARRRRRDIRIQAREESAQVDVGVSDRVDLERALAGLSADDRMLISLSYLGGLSSKEIAEVLGVSPSAVRGRLARAIQRLRREMTHE